MKISKLLNKKYFLIIISLLTGLNSFADEKPVDIWNIEKKKEKKKIISNKNLKFIKKKIFFN